MMTACFSVFIFSENLPNESATVPVAVFFMEMLAKETGSL
jgi:hypothetical protein